MTLRKCLLLSAVIIAALAFAVGCDKKKSDAANATEPKAEVAEFVIGAQNPETGPIAMYGTQAVHGAKLAVEEINAAGGINGKPVKLLNYDSRGDKTEAVNLTKRLLNANVCGIMGEVTSGGLFAMRDTAQRGKTVAISAGATAQGVTDSGDFIFSDALLDSDGAPAIVKFVMDKYGYKNFAVITSVNNDYSVGLSEFFKNAIKENGGNLVIEQNISDGDTDLSAQITSFRGKDIDAVVFSGYYSEAALILLELQKQGIKAPLIGGDGFQSPELWNIAKDAAVGTIFYAGFASTSPEENVQNFIKNLEAKGVTADQFSANGYDAIYLLANAIRDAGVTDCSDPAQREKIKNALATVKDFHGVSGTMSFKENGSASKQPFIQQVVKDEAGVFSTILLN